MLSNFHRTTSEHWWRTPGTQKCSPFSSKEVGKNIKDKKRDKRVRDGDPYWGGSLEGGEVSKHQETLLPARSVGNFGISKGFYNQEHTHTHTHTHRHTHKIHS